MICGFCRQEYFLDRPDTNAQECAAESQSKSKGDWRDHHQSAEAWIKSIDEDCTICIALEKDLRELLVREDNSKHPFSVNASKVFDGKFEDQVLSSKIMNETVKEWPLYRVTLWDDTVHEWTMKFQPYPLTTSTTGGDSKLESDVSGGSTLISPAEIRERLPCRNFIICPWQDIQGEYRPETGTIGGDDPVLGDYTDSPQALSQISTWIKNCCERHRACKCFVDKQAKWHTAPSDSDKRPFLPTRLLDVGKAGDTDIRLVETDDDTVGPYTTLSHKWGLKDIWMLKPTYNKDVEEEFQKPIPLTKFYPTFRDAVIVTRHLKIQYLWIDSLCIRQQDNEDWHREAPKMAEVYGNSYCNIAATDAFDARGGLFRTRVTTALAPSKVEAGSQFIPKGTYGVVREDFWAGEILSQPLYQRGWVFQERMLSPRILHFGPTQIFYQCISQIACESAPWGLPPAVLDLPSAEARWRDALHNDRFVAAAAPGPSASSTASPPTSKTGKPVSHRRHRHPAIPRNQNLGLDQIWADAVYSYSSCALTVATDKLMAMAGIAKEMQKALGGERYLAGLWGEGPGGDLHEQLGWRVEKAGQADGTPAVRKEVWWKGTGKGELEEGQKEEYRAPSWSWMSLDGVVRVVERAVQGRTYVARFPEVGLRVEDEEHPVGKILPEAYLRAQGWVLRMRFAGLGSRVVAGNRGNDQDGKDVFGTLEPGEMVWWADGVDPGKVECRAYLDCESDEQVDPNSENQQPAAYLVFLLAFSYNKPPRSPQGYSGHGLLLKPTQAPDGFSRIGCLRFHSLDNGVWGALKGCKLQSNEDAGSEAYDLDTGRIITIY